MKKIIILALGLGLFSTAATAQKVNVKSKAKTTKAIAAPSSVKNKFSSEYSAAKSVVWASSANGNFIAKFNNPEGNNQMVEYTKSGEFVSGKTVYKIDATPEAVQKAIAKDYADYSVESVMKMNLPNLDPYYKVKVKANGGGLTKQLLVSEEGDISE